MDHPSKDIAALPFRRSFEVLAIVLRPLGTVIDLDIQKASRTTLNGGAG
jgi:hypothetical protein